MNLKLIDLPVLDIPNPRFEGERLTEALEKERGLRLTTYFKVYNQAIVIIIQESGGELSYRTTHLVYAGVRYGTRRDSKRRLIVYAVSARDTNDEKPRKKTATKKSAQKTVERSTKKTAKKKTTRKPATRY